MVPRSGRPPRTRKRGGMAKADQVHKLRQAWEGGCGGGETRLFSTVSARMSDARRLLRGGPDRMNTLALLQIDPGWVGPTIAISLAVIALSIVGAAVAAGIAVLRLSGQARKIAGVIDGLQDDVGQAVKS